MMLYFSFTTSCQDINVHYEIQTDHCQVTSVLQSWAIILLTAHPPFSATLFSPPQSWGSNESAYWAGHNCALTLTHIKRVCLHMCVFPLLVFQKTKLLFVAFLLYKSPKDHKTLTKIVKSIWIHVSLVFEMWPHGSFFLHWGMSDTQS